MVPWCDQINHENVNVCYDCLDSKSGEPLLNAEEKLEKLKREEGNNKDKNNKFLTDLKNDLVELGNKCQSNNQNTIRIQTKAFVDKKIIDQKTDKLREDLIEDQKKKDEEHDSDVSSGIESDNDLDLLVE